MRKIIVGYGEFKDYKLQEVPASFLNELAQRYPLKADHHSDSEWKELLITIGIHEELERRRSGGEELRHRSTKKQFALEIVTKGFHQLSKAHHPDRNGDNESQTLLTQARDILKSACAEIEEGHSRNDVIIEAPAVLAEITDEDIPF